ncbi:hypothetical protein BKP45_16160 [Anaerobacillus alkalidiazotrophicus]|uniref:DUF418 domain-containing protein n=1 Tax=Anaerobacillus alkalidiazotrophicus TaxID=472963 RepID=A0A1S2M220_9BACI|nr:DUF418 domain-containing protein [Anaerobacillus alkalidiazotrophicus]OIJ18664.1 hypothetical protein BKP45_16160 [Anaerobacillus alkalidiazotrophicus]
MIQEKTQNELVEKLTPIDSRDRLHHIDSLRGFALLGILIVNMLAFQYGTAGFQFGLLGLTDLALYDKATLSLIEWFFLGSFYPIFSILFGFGAVMMWERAQTKRHPFKRVFFRRMLLLLLFGLGHYYFIWDGDILLTYAIAGIIFMLFMKRKPKTLLIWAIVIVVLMNGPGLLDRGSGEGTDFSPFAEYQNKILTEGSYFDVVHHRLNDNPFSKNGFNEDIGSEEQEINASFMMFLVIITGAIQMLTLLIIGGYIAKKRLLHDLAANKQALKRATMFFLLIGLSLKVFIIFTDNAILWAMGYVLGGPLTAIGYIAAFALLFTKFSSSSLFRHLAYLGRMALTNYLLQSVVMTTIFYGYGLGLFGKLGILIGTLLALAFIIIQIAFSRWWLKRFKFGPMEWVWRNGTYLRRQPLKKKAQQLS